MQTQTVIEAATPWLTIIVLLAVVAALVLWLVKPLHKFARTYALGVSVAILVLFAIAFATEFNFDDPAAFSMAETYTWIPQIGVSLAWGVNGMSAVMIFLAAFLVPVVILAAFKEERLANGYGFYAWILALEAIMIALFATRDLFVFYILFEAMIIPVYFLIGRYGGADRARAAMKFLLFSLAGGLIMLVGVIAVYAYGPGGMSGYLFENLAGSLTVTGGAEMLFFLSFFIAFAIKAPMWPVHTWLPDTAANSTPGTSTLLVSVLDKLGTYGMIAICVPLFPNAAASAAPFIIVLALISIIWGAAMAIGSNNLMRLIAYTSVSHFGFMVLGIFSGSKLAMTGAILYMVAHGVGTAGLFLTVGFLERRGKSYLISDYGGWQRVTPLIAGAFLIAGLATIALPGLSGFIPEYLVLMGTFSVNKWAAIIAVIGVVLAAIYILLPYQRAFTGPKPAIEAQDLDGTEKTVVGVLIAAMLFLGFYPAPVLDLVTPVAEQAATYIAAPEEALSGQAAATVEGSN